MVGRKYSDLLTANQIRKTFVDYFTQNGHSYIKSSPVKPFVDSSLEFVNAGMNQFKNVFLGLERIPVKRATNSQKCIRVGGKHNDLNCVGHDSYHHTFFEMLGNWSFNDYFKEEACRFAWALVTQKPFALDPKRLYVTYFGGHLQSNLEPDLETKEIWLKIGVPKERIIPFGLKDNFWEMGFNGPCGPCTEIHYDHLGTQPRPQVVNSGLPDLTELWNLVFIQYNRLEGGQLEKLNKHFVDTGMGLERLVALLQNKTSNYDTDLFSPYFSTISKLSGVREYGGKFSEADFDGLDTAYRILADHSRMITVAVADNIFPRESYGVRRVIRKALFTAEKVMPGKSVELLLELCRVAGGSFAETFPETLNNQNQIMYVIQDENEIWEQTKAKVKLDWENAIQKCPDLKLLSDVQSPGLIASLRELENWKLSRGAPFPTELSLIMYDRHGLNTQVIEQVAEVFDHTIDVEVIEEDILKLKASKKLKMYSSKIAEIPQRALEYLVNNYKPTNDSFKSNYTRDREGQYTFPSLKCAVDAILVDGEIVHEFSSLKDGMSVSLVLDRTNLWLSLKGDGDSGTIKITHQGNPFAEIPLDMVVNVKGYICHFGTLRLHSTINGVSTKDLEAEVFIDSNRRLEIMRNTSAAHLLNIAFKKKFVANLKSLAITEKDFLATFSIYGHEISEEDIKLLEEDCNKLINEGINVELSSKSTNDIVDISDISIPPFVNAGMSELQLAKFDLDGGLREVTVGPNVLNTEDVKEVCIVKVDKKSKNREISVVGITGESIKTAKETAESLLSLLSSEESATAENLQKAKYILNNSHIPWGMQSVIDEKFLEFMFAVKRKGRKDKTESLKKKVLNTQEIDKFLVMYVGKESKIEKIFDSSVRIPVLLFGVHQKYLTASCYVPEGFGFSAEEWVSELAKEFGAPLPLKNQDQRICSLKGFRVNTNQLSNLIEKFEDSAKLRALQLLDKRFVDLDITFFSDSSCEDRNVTEYFCESG